MNPIEKLKKLASDLTKDARFTLEDVANQEEEEDSDQKPDLQHILELAKEERWGTAISALRSAFKISLPLTTYDHLLLDKIQSVERVLDDATYGLVPKEVAIRLLETFIQEES